MTWLGPPDASPAQRALIALLSIAIGGAVMAMVFARDFVPAPEVDAWASRAAWWLAGGLCATIFVLWVAGHVRFYPSPSWSSPHRFSWFGKAVVILFSPVFAYWVFWINIAVLPGKLYTVIEGEQGRIVERVSRERGTSWRQCDYALAPESVVPVTFRFCVAEEAYHRFPEDPALAELTVHRSALGYSVEAIRWRPDQRR